MLSIIIPFHNEQENLPILHEEIVKSIKSGTEYEMIFVDDGSTDTSKKVITDIAQKDEKVKLTSFAKRRGKGYALSQGLELAKGKLIMFMDADLQDDPKEIPHFIAKIEEGYDFVNGVRKKRTHNLLLKLFSRMGNLFIALFSGSPFTDINCGFKAFRKEVLEDIPLYGNNFRFFPLAVYYEGYRVSEIMVDHRARIHDKPKFGPGKVVIGFFDTLTAYFLYRFSERPLHFFGSIGTVFFGLGFLVSVYLVFERLFYGVLLYRRPGLQFAVLFVVIGIQIIMTGFIGELIVYMHKKNKR